MFRHPRQRTFTIFASHILVAARVTAVEGIGMERNLTGEPDMDKESGIRPNFSDLARRYGVDRHTVARRWNGGGATPPDGRSGRDSGSGRYRDETGKKVVHHVWEVFYDDTSHCALARLGQIMRMALITICIGLR